MSESTTAGRSPGPKNRAIGIVIALGALGAGAWGVTAIQSADQTAVVHLDAKPSVTRPPHPTHPTHPTHPKKGGAGVDRSSVDAGSDNSDAGNDRGNGKGGNK